MTFLSFNCPSVVSPSKKMVLHHFFESNQPDIIFLQETLGSEDTIIPILESLLNQSRFIGSYEKERTWVITIGWNLHSVNILNSWGFDSGLGMKIFSQDLGREIMVINVYGTYLE